MQILRYSIIAVLAAGCSKQAPPSSLDLYYRPFSATSIVRLTESIMLTSAGAEAKITDAGEIANILKSLPDGCDPSEMKEEDMDLRVLIYLNYSGKRETWKADNFSYYDSRAQKMCKMSPDLQEQVEAPLARFRT